jgi:hypothetical protein
MSIVGHFEISLAISANYFSRRFLNTKIIFYILIFYVQ